MEPDITFKVATMFPCNSVNNHNVSQNALWTQTMLGCMIIQLIQEIHSFNVSYVYQQEDPKRDVTNEIKMYLNKSTIDFYARPLSLRTDVLELAQPVGAIFDWDFGFTINRPDVTYRNFYTKPFTRRVWNVLYIVGFFCSIFFYLLKRWENKVKKGVTVWECSYGYELLMVIGAYCQHIPPIEARLLSRRTAYLVFFIFAFVVYTYYTSNLLSHLVNDKYNSYSLEELLESGIECVVLANIKSILDNNIASIYSGDKISAVLQKMLNLRPVSIDEGLQALKTTKTALLSDYVTIAPYIRSVFNSNGICNLGQIDVVSNIKKYLFVSKTFPYVDEFKVRLPTSSRPVYLNSMIRLYTIQPVINALEPHLLLRLREAGLLKRLVKNHYHHPTLECSPQPNVQTQFLQIAYPVYLLVGVYVLCLIILFIEIMYHRRYKVWPYVN